MDIQFVLTEAAPNFEFSIPTEMHHLGGSLFTLISGIAAAVDAVVANPEAVPPVEAADAIPANTVAVQYALPAGVDAAAGGALAEVWVDSGKALAADGLHSIPVTGVREGKMRFVLSGERDMRIRIFF